MQAIKALTQAQLDCKIATSTGIVHPFHVRPGEINVQGMAHRMAGLYRFGGDTRITVAQHCTDGEYFLRRDGASPLIRFAYLIHDGGEGISGLGDIPAPILACLPEVDAINKYCQEAVYLYCLSVTELDAETRAAVHAMDIAMRAMEARYCHRNWQEIFPELREIVPPPRFEHWRGPISPERAEEEYLERFYELEAEWEGERR
jgi:hypothetical protein